MANLHGLIFGWRTQNIRILRTDSHNFRVGARVCRERVLARARGRSDDLLIAISVSTVVSYYLLIHDLSVLFLRSR